MNWLRKYFGLCVHDWSIWRPIYASDYSETGKTRECLLCEKCQYEYFSEGH